MRSVAPEDKRDLVLLRCRFFQTSLQTFMRLSCEHLEGRSLIENRPKEPQRGAPLPRAKIPLGVFTVSCADSTKIVGMGERHAAAAFCWEGIAQWFGRRYSTARGFIRFS